MYSHHVAAFIILLLLGQSQRGLCFFFSSGSLTSELGRDLFYVGETLTLHCHKGSPFNGSVVRFQVGNAVIGQQYITLVNNTDARLDKPVTGADYAEAQYYCYDNDPEQVGQKKIYTDYAPRSATDFGMVWLEKNDLTMSWKFGNIRYKNSHEERVIRVDATWGAELNNGVTSWNPCDSHTNTTCTKNGFTDIGAIISVRVTITNVKRSEEVTTILPGLRVKDHGKPERIEILSATVVDSKSVLLTVKADWAELNFRIHYCAVVNGVEECSMTETGYTHNKTLTVSDLHPSYTYTFRVQAKFDTGGFFSDDSSGKTLTLPEAAPTQAPTVTRGSFYLDRTTCSKKDPNATAYIYFQEVAEEHQNGKIQNYTGDVRASQGPFIVSTRTGSERTLKAEQLDCQQAFIVFVYASNAVGRSPSTVLSVPPWNPELYNKVKSLDLRLKVKKDGKVTAEWTPNAKMADVTLLLYYCSKDASDPNKCLEAIQHVEVRPMAGRHPLPLAEGNMMFGAVALTPEGVTTGIVTTNCIYNPDESVGEVISDVKAIGLVGRIEVSWQGQRCGSSKRIVILNYVVQVCEELQESECRQYRVDGQYNRKDLRDMTPGTTYMVKVQANTTSGPTLFSTPVPATVLDGSGGLPVDAIIGIVSAVILVCIIVGTVIFCYCRDRCRRLKRPFKPQLPKSLFGVDGVDNLGASHNHADESPATDPDNTHNTPPLLKQQISDDSGIDQESPPLSPSSATPGTTTEPSKPGPGEQPSAPSTVPSVGVDMLDVNSFTSPGLTSDSMSPSQDEDGPDNTSQEDSGSLPPYVRVSTNEPADNAVSGTATETPQPMWGGNQPIVYHVSCDQPVLCPDNYAPSTGPFLMPGTETGMSVGLAGGKNMAGPARGTESGMSVGLAGGKNVAGPARGREDGTLQKQEADKDAGKFKTPSSLDDQEKRTDLPPASKYVSSYVRLSTADPAADAISQSLTHEGADSQSECGDVLEDDTLADAGQEEIFLPLSASGNVEGDKKVPCADAIQSYVHLSPVTDTGEDAEPVMTVGHLGPAPDSLPEDPAHHKEAETRMNPAYVTFPVSLPSASDHPDAADDNAQDLTDQMKDSLHPQGKVTSLHPGYVPCAVQSTHDHDQEALWTASGKKSSASRSDRVETSAGQGSGEPVAASCNGYVPFTSVPGAASPPGENNRLPATSTTEADESDSDSFCGLQPEISGDNVGKDWPARVEVTLDEKGYVHIGDGADGSRLEGSSNGKQTHRGGGGLPDKTSLADTEVRVPVNSNGYVPWQSLPFNTVDRPRVDTGKSQTEPKQPPGYIRLDSGYLSPSPEVNCSSPWQRSSPTGHNHHPLQAQLSGLEPED